jgi:hypothetical protein
MREVGTITPSAQLEDETSTGEGGGMALACKGASESAHEPQVPLIYTSGLAHLHS